MFDTIDVLPVDANRKGMMTSQTENLECVCVYLESDSACLSFQTLIDFAKARYSVGEPDVIILAEMFGERCPSPYKCSTTFGQGDRI